MSMDEFQWHSDGVSLKNARSTQCLLICDCVLFLLIFFLGFRELQITGGCLLWSVVSKRQPLVFVCFHSFSDGPCYVSQDRLQTPGFKHSSYSSFLSSWDYRCTTP